LREGLEVGESQAHYLGSQYASAKKLDTIRKERGTKYGPVKENHETIGMQWAGILTHSGWTPGEPIPARIVCLMMVALKLNREAYSPQEDNIIDGKNYLDFAGELSGNDEPSGETDGTEREAFTVQERQERTTKEGEYWLSMYKGMQGMQGGE